MNEWHSCKDKIFAKAGVAGRVADLKKSRKIEISADIKKLFPHYTLHPKAL
ncbi:hypothetical protein [Nostoc sp.]|uniref:hypothetical protein n=1 Tax=Nostoc sp. TaxID=1180 RepID=UPI002FFC9C45